MCLEDGGGPSSLGVATGQSPLCGEAWRASCCYGRHQTSADWGPLGPQNQDGTFLPADGKHSVHSGNRTF